MPAVLWKQLETDGHDTCRFKKTATGWSLDGTAVFDHEGHAAALNYTLLCDSDWTSRQAHVKGWVGQTDIDVLIERTDNGHWHINGTNDPNLDDLKDIDLGFTPATNTNAIRRLNLSNGKEAQSTAIWLDTADWTVKMLPQTYRRIDDQNYAYTSPLHDYQATLRVDDFGIVRDYPALWMAIDPKAG
ncbi:putative glycolipid-binding domain-containing protein [Aestuariibius sp. 2305UL40-4]|uniref:putative glycolipid-binding domain-containing protein n=1 Tax=Aestuariibius violaceus TaxID=3234132 RepID=UPI00345E663A